MQTHAQQNILIGLILFWRPFGLMDTNFEHNLVNFVGQSCTSKHTTIAWQSMININNN